MKIVKKILKHLGAISIAGFCILLLLLCLVLLGNMIMSKSIAKKDIVVIPDLAGLDLSEARTVLGKLHLSLQENDYEYHELDLGKIISQSPPKNRLIYANRTIEVIVSRGPKIVYVPPLSGIEFKMIEEYLKNFELKLGNITQHYSNEMPAGYVIDSDPPSGTGIMAGKEVNIIISIGKDPIDFPEPVFQEYYLWEDDLY